MKTFSLVPTLFRGNAYSSNLPHGMRSHGGRWEWGLFFSLLSLAISVASARAEIEEDSVTVLRDPFQKPVLSQPLVKPKKASQANKLSWRPSLVMTLRAGDNSMANVGGQVVKLGEKIDGYKLIEVYERAVVFVKQGEITRLTLDEEDEENAIHENF